jgi:Recombination endonuclease VII
LVKLGETPTRKCTECGLLSDDLELFIKSKDSKYGRRNLCISCACKRVNQNPNNKDWKTDHQTKKRYGIDSETYKRLMATSPCCQICGKTEELCYDHCHDTMKFRGVLCRGCNRSLGQLGDNIEGIKKVLDYLQKE